MYLDDKTILVAGANGLAGSSIVRALLGASPTVRLRATCRSDIGAFSRDPRVTYIRADLRSSAECATAVKGCDAAVLAAARSGGAQQAANAPWLQVTDNLVMDTLLLQALHDAGIRRAVYVSSGTIYPELSDPMREDQLDWNSEPPKAYQGVGWAKRSAEKLCTFWHRQTGMEILIARSSNIYGPYSKFDPATANFIPALIRKAGDALDPFEVWGGPDVVRDVIYADDFGSAIVALLNATHIAHDIFNVGSGQGVTVGEVVDLILKSSNHVPGQVVWQRQGPTTTSAARVLDCSKIRDMTAWRASCGLEDGIRQTVQWWRANKATWPR
ncbi:MAG TPA: NAD(P)-dependent oxidoreductase [Magnetospirillaceae bacterium]|jgi:GDP-L-fucose synthase